MYITVTVAGRRHESQKHNSSKMNYKGLFFLLAVVLLAFLSTGTNNHHFKELP
jgi:hypothetical protein